MLWSAFLGPSTKIMITEWQGNENLLYLLTLNTEREAAAFAILTVTPWNPGSVDMLLHAATGKFRFYVRTRNAGARKLRG